MDIPEFIDTYSDDIIYILEGRSALLTHPLRIEMPSLVNASTSRLLIVFAIGATEAMLSDWLKRDPNKILQVYFEFEKRPSGERVTALRQAFHHAGITVDPDVFNDYLAIKYLRNTIVHGKWVRREQAWVEGRGFPPDTRRLTKEHLDRIVHAYQNMMWYIFLTQFPAPGVKMPTRLARLGEKLTEVSDITGILRLQDLDRIIWNNLDRMHEAMFSAITKAATTEPYSWTNGWKKDQLAGMSPDEQKRLFYLAARRASEHDFSALVEHRNMCAEALAFWQVYWQRAIMGRGLHETDIEDSISTLSSPEFADFVRENPSLRNLTLDDSRDRELEPTFGSSIARSTKEITAALRTSRIAYELVPNITPVALFKLYSPIVDPENTAAYLKEGDRAASMFRLSRIWYSWAEHHELLLDGGLAFYESMRRELANRPQSA